MMIRRPPPVRGLSFRVAKPPHLHGWRSGVEEEREDRGVWMVRGGLG